MFQRDWDIEWDTKYNDLTVYGIPKYGGPQWLRNDFVRLIRLRCNRDQNWIFEGKRYEPCKHNSCDILWSYLLSKRPSKLVDSISRHNKVGWPVVFVQLNDPRCLRPLISCPEITIRKQKYKGDATTTSSWWFQPIWKIFVKMGIFPK